MRNLARELLRILRESRIEEDAPANCAGGGAIAGIGVGPKGEPGVNLKKKKLVDEDAVPRYKCKSCGYVFAMPGDRPEECPKCGYSKRPPSAMRESIEDTAHVFEVDNERVMKSRFGKNRYHRWSRYIGEDEVGQQIREAGKTTKKDIVLKDGANGPLMWLRRKHMK